MSSTLTFLLLHEAERRNLTNMSISVAGDDHSSRSQHIHALERNWAASEAYRLQIRRMSGYGEPYQLYERPVLAILSPSRGYSSLLFALLRHNGRFLALRGEHTHLYKLSGISRPLDFGRSDGTVNVTPATIFAFREALAWELTEDLDPPWFSNVHRLEHRSFQIAHRLYAQWAHLPEPDTLVPLISTALSRLIASPGRPDTRFLRLIQGLGALDLKMNPWYYDIPGETVSSVFPTLSKPVGPPRNGAGIEEPPFIVPHIPGVEGSTRSADSTEPLLIKASVDIHRLKLLPELFGTAITYVHLTRNPAAAVSGLMDGWLSHKFYSHRLPSKSLDIKGYSDTPAGTWGWWNFDAPRGWETFIKSELVNVCAHQWLQGHTEILSSQILDPLMRIKGESIVGTTRWELIGQILRLSGMAAGALDHAYYPVVMSSQQPAPGRWRRRYFELRKVLELENLKDMADELGYGPVQDETWI